MLNLFLRYLHYSCGTTSEWLSDEQIRFKGFSRRGDSERDIIGIHMWSEPFLCQLENGKEVAVVLMNTQLDSKNKPRESGQVLALSAMTSSIQGLQEFMPFITK